MQMSIERFKELHKYIWNYVIERYDRTAYPCNQIWYLKNIAVFRALESKMLDDDEAAVIYSNNSCMLCATATSCDGCALETCTTENSPFFRAYRGDKNAMIEIRDVVDNGFYDGISIIEIGV